MFTLALHYLPGGQHKTSAHQSVRSSYIPQKGSTIDGGDVRGGLHEVILVSQMIGADSTMSEVVYVYLKETDLEDNL